jgi:HAD superfamily hydrolase (TIGR01459 family)
MTPRFPSSLLEIAARYDAFLLDLWGVVHDGQTLYPNALDRLRRLQALDKRIIFLSNAPKRAGVVAGMLGDMGIGSALYQAIVTSGETLHQALSDTRQRFYDQTGSPYYYIGHERDRFLLEGLPYRETDALQEARFILLTHSFYDNQPLEELRPVLAEAKALGLPLLCANPDLEVIRMNQERVYCAGLLARLYEEMGGETLWFGKPFQSVYEACFRILGEPARPSVLAIGDSLKTDILGGKGFRLDTALITGGILQPRLPYPGDSERYRQEAVALCAAEKSMPDYILPAL